MQDNLNKLPENLSKKICEDFLSGKYYEDKDDIHFKIKEQLLEFAITDIDFLTIKQCVECLCLLKGVSFQIEYVDTGLSSLFNIKQTEFRKIDVRKLSTKIDKAALHIRIITVLSTTCKNLTHGNQKFTLRFEVIRGGGYKYYLQKDTEDKYICFHPNLYEGEIYIRKFMSIKPDLKDGAPDILKAGRKFIPTHSYSPKLPFFDGFFIDEIERVIKILEEYEIEQLADTK
jgi:hypothetical protein